MLYFYEYHLLLNITLTLTLSWIFFIKSNFFPVRVKTTKDDKVTSSNIIKKSHYSTYTLYFLILIGLLWISLFTVRGVSTTFFFNQFCVNNFHLKLANIYLIILYLTFGLLFILTTNNVNYNNNFVFSITNLSLFIVLLFFSNNLLSFLFILEINSILIFYMFLASKYWYKKGLFDKATTLTQLNRVLPKQYLSLLFFQYWVSFFSSILLFFSLANILYFYGSLEFFVLELLNIHIIKCNIISWQNFLQLLWFPLIIGFFLKIGLTPFHLFKIEVYRGLPFVSLLTYTTFYFFGYFSYFILLFTQYIYCVNLLLNPLFLLVMTIGIIYLTFLMFDITALKSFFAYSTIINAFLIFAGICIV